MKVTTAIFTALVALGIGITARAQQDLLIKLAPGAIQSASLMASLSTHGGSVEAVTDEWIRVQRSDEKQLNLSALKSNPQVLYVQPNYKIKLHDTWSSNDPKVLARFAKASTQVTTKAYQDNPPIPQLPQISTGKDPLYGQQWGMDDIGVKEGWSVHRGNKNMIVAVIDTGVDYTHEDLNGNMWRNPGEQGLDAQGKDKSSNGIDDDKNGYIDDIVGWDFVTNDNKPYDLAVEPLQLIRGGNPGHGTHCAGNVGASTDNGKGVVGVAPNIKIMALRFISEKGAGTTDQAIRAIRYAVDNGAMITSNSWGSEGEDPEAGEENKALRDAIQYSQDKGALFIAAAGNGHKGVGYSNDTDAAPAYPASYDHDSIISVAAIDSADNFGGFSNWGLKTVDIGAPGVKVFSTTVGSQYSDKVIDFLGFEAFWDGTSMATPHVAGAAAIYWSAHPEKTWQQVKDAILNSARPTQQMKGKVSSGGKLDVRALMKF